MACTRDRAAQIDDMAGGRLEPDPALELLDHLAGCPACSERLDLVADLVRVAEAGGEAFASAPASSGSSRPRLRLVVGVVATLAAAAVLLLLVVPRPSTTERMQALAQLAPPAVAGTTLRGEAAAEEAAFAAALERYEAGDFGGAVERLTEVVAAAPDDPLAYFYLGVARLQLGADEAAITTLAKATNLAEGLLQERALWFLANAHLARGEGPEARTAFERLVAAQGDYELNARDALEALAPLLRE